MRTVAGIGIVIYPAAGDIMTANRVDPTSQLTRLGTMVVSTGSSQPDQLQMNSSATRPIMMGVFLESHRGLNGSGACGRLNHSMAALNRIVEFEKEQLDLLPAHLRILTVWI